MSIDLVFITYNRLEYTKLALASVLSDPTEEFSLTIWDNGSTDKTPEYLKSLKDPRIKEVVLRKENFGQAGAMNYVWSKTKAELIGKLDNDCLVTPGWTRVFARVHKDVENLGAIACWHYPLDEFDEKAARRAGKIQSFGNHQILRHPSVCGSGFIMKRRTFEKYGQWKAGPDVGTTYYFKRMSLGGFINGWHFPLVLQEHMDDPRSKHCLVTDDESLRGLYDVTYTLRELKIRDMKSRWARRLIVLKDLNSEPWDVKYYVGWRGKIRSLRERVRKTLRI